jgi:signal transduction histidine kinase
MGRLSHRAQCATVTRPSRFHTLLWLGAGLLAALGAGLLARAELQRQREAFDTDARIVHRLLSQRVVQHDAMLATLALLQPVRDGEHAEQRLPAVFPQVLQARRRREGEAWPQASLTQAETTSRARRRAALGAVDLAQGRYELVTAAGSGAYALLIDLKQTVPWDEWPMKPDSSPVRVRLVLGDAHYTVQPGRAAATSLTAAPGWTFSFSKVLASESQAFDVQAQLSLGWGALPWWRMLAWVALVLAGASAWQAWRRQNTARRRAEELLRLGQVARLNTLGELAAGVAHELNQPLTAVLANTQAAQRLLAEDPPELPLVQTAMAQAAQQARRAAEVVGRLRRVVERPDTQGATAPTPLEQAARSALHLLEPEFKRRQASVVLEAEATPTVLADPVALEQIVHNLLMNALQALEQVPTEHRHIRLRLGMEGNEGLLQVSDSGPGIPDDVLPRLFQPFFSTREGGLGLGLSLCETLAVGMGGSLGARNASPLGAEFTLRLPLAT